jgi:hypothetical protein
MIAALLMLTSASYGSTLYVANNGLDGSSCGAKKSPCRSISQAVNTNAADGDTIIVGPGGYGDLNRNGTLGDSPGEEAGGFDCVLVVARAVTITSSGGAAATTIDGRNDSTSCNVGIVVDGTQFGKPGKGFTVTNTSLGQGRGIVLNANNLAVQGNQVIATDGSGLGTGIYTVDFPEDILIEGNQVVGWGFGMWVQGTGKRVLKNSLTQNSIAIFASGTNLISGNLITSNYEAIEAAGPGAGDLIGNAVYANVIGFGVDVPFGGRIEKNNIFGNSGCGLENGDPTFGGVLGLDATNNYWGASTGPGSDPADGVCNLGGGTSVTTPFATKPFKVKAPIKP